MHALPFPDAQYDEAEQYLKTHSQKPPQYLSQGLLNHILR